MTADPVADPRGQRTWRVTLPRVAGSFTYRVENGPARSDRHAIRAVEAPAVASLDVRVEPPAYTAQPPYPARDPYRIDAREGSAVTLTLTTNRPVVAAELDWPAPAPGEGPGTAADVDDVRSGTDEPPTERVAMEPSSRPQHLDGHRAGVGVGGLRAFSGRSL